MARLTALVALLLLTGVPAHGGEATRRLTEARSLLHHGRGLEALETARAAAAALAPTCERPSELPEFDAVARVLRQLGDGATARQVESRRVRALAALVGIPLPSSAGPAEIGAALAAARNKRNLTAEVRAIALNEALHWLGRAGDSPTVRAQRALVLAAQGRTREAWVPLVEGLRADPSAGELRAAVAAIALDHGRTDLALKVLAPRAGVEARRIASSVATVVASLDASGQTTRAYELGRGWLAQWTFDDVTRPLLAAHARLASKVGDVDAELAARCHLIDPGTSEGRAELGALLFSLAGAPPVALAAGTVGLQSTSTEARGPRSAMLADPVRRVRALANLAKVPDAAFREDARLAQGAAHFAETAGDLDAAVRIWELHPRGEALEDAEPVLEAFHGRLLGQGKGGLAAQLAKTADAARPPLKWAIDEDRGAAKAGQVLVRMGRERCMVEVASGRIVGAEPKQSGMKRYARLIARTLQVYPAGFVERLKLVRFTLYRSPHPEHPGFLAWTNFRVPTIDLCLAKDEGDEEWIDALHHELYHVIDHQLGQLDHDGEWEKLNAPGFRYSGKIDVACPNVRKEQRSFAPGLLNGYAAAASWEDKPVVFANMMRYPEEMAARAARDPILARKMALLRARCAQYFGKLDDGFFSGAPARASSRGSSGTRAGG